ncbi:MAG: UvrD-helicase domain-containing protein [Deltaproteobacteria bacterium]|nr:UvrD-helicase domain-containing protein [Deltaproteobacteria bacterium]
MTFIADLHIHSRFSRATSRDLNPENLSFWAQKKGIKVIGTGDFTHPEWIAELREKLVEEESGLYGLTPDLEKAIQEEVPESCRGPVRFLLSSEISCIYKRDGKTRKLHHLILMPDFDSVIKLNQQLDRIGNIKSDGRPILGLDSRDLLEIVLEASDRAFFIPAHIWTPWFSVFGSKSGFDTLEECFGDLVQYIHALETGLSSDPPMNRLLTALDRYTLVSNSDAHSASKLGREANLFDTDLGYDAMIRAMTTTDGFQGTIEFYPEEGKYHMDGHRKCQVLFHPHETREHQGICPSCGKPLTVGVLHRVVELADRDHPILTKDFFSLIPLTEILAEIHGCGPATKKVISLYGDLLSTLGPELRILMDVPLKEIEEAGGALLATAIDRMRKDEVIKQEGYDGEYGVIHLFHQSEMAQLCGQQALFDMPKEEISKKQESLPASKPSRQRSKKQGGQWETPGGDPILDPLNPEQKEAVLHQGGHLLIVAGPGTGKTMTLSHRIAHMIHSGWLSSDRILALTFTNKAAREMKKRIDALISKEELGRVKVATFHGFCLEVLREHGERLNLPQDFRLCSESDVPIIAGEVVAGFNKGKRYLTVFLKDLPIMKTNDVMREEIQTFEQDLLEIFQRYQEKLRGLNMLDLDDLEVETLRLFQDHPDVVHAYGERFEQIFVDEYQDTNPLQVQILKKMVRADSSGICAIGDPDQAIYGFRGADVQNYYDFERDFPGAKKIALLKNYRSTQVILDGAAGIMGKGESLEGVVGKGDSIRMAVCQTQAEEAEMVVEQIEKIIGGTSYFSLDSGRVASHEGGEDLSFGDMAVLFRLNIQGNDLQEAFVRAGIPFIRSGEKPLISRYPVNILFRLFQAVHFPQIEYYRRAYLDLGVNETGKGEKVLQGFDPDMALSDLIDWAVSAHGFDLTSDEAKESLRRVRELAFDFDGDMGSFLDILSLDRGIDHEALRGDRVALMSLHAAKGLEWPVVFIVGCEDKMIPCTLFGDCNEGEEKRLFYVGMTRARQRLILSHVKRRKVNGPLWDMDPSPFIEMIPKHLCETLERAGWKRKAKAHQQLSLFGN